MFGKTVYIIAAIALAITGCNSKEQKEETVSSQAPPEQVKMLSQADRDNITAFRKDLLSIENVSKNALTLVGEEVKLVIKGEKGSIDMASLVDKAKAESGTLIGSLVKEAVPGKLPPWFSRNLTDAKDGFCAAYKAKIESLDAVKKFLEDKNPLSLLEYRKKAALADKLIENAKGKLALVWSAAGLPAENAVTTGAPVNN